MRTCEAIRTWYYVQSWKIALKVSSFTFHFAEEALVIPVITATVEIWYIPSVRIALEDSLRVVSYVNCTRSLPQKCMSVTLIVFSIKINFLVLSSCITCDMKKTSETLTGEGKWACSCTHYVNSRWETYKRALWWIVHDDNFEWIFIALVSDKDGNFIESL